MGVYIRVCVAIVLCCYIRCLTNDVWMYLVMIQNNTAYIKHDMITIVKNLQKILIRLHAWVNECMSLFDQGILKCLLAYRGNIRKTILVNLFNLHYIVINYSRKALDPVLYRDI